MIVPITKDEHKFKCEWFMVFEITGYQNLIFPLKLHKMILKLCRQNLCAFGTEQNWIFRMYEIVG